MVTNRNGGGNAGTFSICINNPLPNIAGTDCATGTLLCSNSIINGNAELWGNQELTTAAIGGCLGQYGEVNSSWYVISIQTGGTLTFTISPSDGTDDYDFAIWKGATCTLGAPLSCNFSSTVPNTGLNNASLSTSQGAAGTPWNQQLITLAGDVYILLINGYTPNASTFNFSFGGTATLGCTLPPVLPIQLVSFSGQNAGPYNLIKWVVASQSDNNYFTIEKSSDGVKFEEADNVNGSGNSITMLPYSYIDKTPYEGVTYYRLSQTDFNGVLKYFSIISVSKTNISQVLKLIKITNILGQEVSEDSEGIKIYYFSDGSVVKKISM
jgi:hypothetical protein